MQGQDEGHDEGHSEVRARLGGAQRVLIHGVTGSGKTTLARRLSAVTGLPWSESDAETWLPGWQQRPLAEQRERIAALCARDRWILDSAYSTCSTSCCLASS